MVVLRLVEKTNHETVKILEGLMSMARRGELRSVAACVQLADGQEKTLLTGAYRVPRLAAWAASRIKRRANRQMD